MKLLRKAILVVGLVCACAMPATNVAAAKMVCEDCVFIIVDGVLVIKCKKCVIEVPVPVPVPAPPGP